MILVLEGADAFSTELYYSDLFKIYAPYSLLAPYFLLLISFLPRQRNEGNIKRKDINPEDP